MLLVVEPVNKQARVALRSGRGTNPGGSNPGRRVHVFAISESASGPPHTAGGCCHTVRGGDGGEDEGCRRLRLKPRECDGGVEEGERGRR